MFQITTEHNLNEPTKTNTNLNKRNEKQIT